MKTYSVAIKVKDGYWVTNIGKYFHLDDINWERVLSGCKAMKALAYGYYYGHKSNELTSGRCRTIIAEMLPA